MSPRKNSPKFGIALLGIAIGAILMFATVDYWKEYATATEAKPVNEKGVGKVLGQINGLYVFIESKPNCDDCYEYIDDFQGENAIDMINKLGIGKEKLGKVLANIFNTGYDRLNFNEHLNILTRSVKNQYTNAEAIIINGNLNRCEVIRYK